MGDEIEAKARQLSEICGFSIFQARKHVLAGKFEKYVEIALKNKLKMQNERRNDNVTTISCPRCEGFLTKRFNKKTGDSFLGCSKYPQCEYSQTIEIPSTSSTEDQR